MDPGPVRGPGDPRRTDREISPSEDRRKSFRGRTVEGGRTSPKVSVEVGTVTEQFFYPDPRPRPGRNVPLVHGPQVVLCCLEGPSVQKIEHLSPTRRPGTRPPSRRTWDVGRVGRRQGEGDSYTSKDVRVDESAEGDPVCPPLKHFKMPK